MPGVRPEVVRDITIRSRAKPASLVCLNASLHPGMGIFHADKDGRASFVYDLMEPVRPFVDRLMLEFVRAHIFKEGDCWKTREGFYRLDPRLTTAVTPRTGKQRGTVFPIVRLVERELGAQHNQSARRT